MAKVVKGIGKVIGTVVKAGAGLVGMLFKQPKVPKATANASTETRLNGSLVPEENRKIIFGETACGTDERFWETYGANNNQHVKVYAAAGHELTSFGNLYLDEFPIPFSGNAASAKYAGQLTRRMVLKGISGAGLTLGSGTRWTPAASMTGCAYFVLDWVYNQEKMTNGIPSRITQIVKGAKVFDPRRWTIYGGTHDPANPDTWEYLPTDSNGQPIGRNNALQMLAYVLGIKVRHAQTNKWVKIGGRGVEIADIDFDTFITAANNCELEGWYSDCILSTGDDHSTNEAILEAAAGGELVDVGGRFSYYVSVDDTADIAAYLNESDIVGNISWVPQEPIAAQFNELPGTFVDPAALFQTRPLPLCFDQAYYDQDGYEKRGEPLKLSAVQDPVQGQKLLRRKLNKHRFQGVFAAPFNLKGARVKPWSNVRLTFEPFGWNNKLFRVKQQGIGVNGGIQLVLREEDPTIYLPGAVFQLAPPSAGYGGNPSEEIPVTGLDAIPSGIVSGNAARDTIDAVWALPSQSVKHTEIRFRKSGVEYWQTAGPLRRDQNFITIQEVVPLTTYEFQVRHVSLWNVPGAWSGLYVTTNAVTRNAAGLLVYADGTTVESLKPAGPNANNTQTNTAAGIAGQGPGATATADQVLNSRVPIGQNGIINSELAGFTVDVNQLPKGWRAGWGGNGTGGGTWGTVLSKGRWSLRVYKTGNDNGTVFDNANHMPDVNGVGLAEVRRYGVSVKPGEKVAFASRLAKFRAARTYLVLAWYDANGSYITETGGQNDSTREVNGYDNHPSTWDLIWGIRTAPANAAYAGIWQRVETNGQAEPHGWMCEPMIAVIQPNADEVQASVPRYRSGPADPLVDRTVENTSAGIIGQGPGATASADLVMNGYLIGPNDNRVTLSGFDRGTTGWSMLYNNPPTNTYSVESGNYQNRNFAKLVVNFTANGQVASIGQTPYRFPVKPGERLAVQCEVELQGVPNFAAMIIQYVNAAGVNFANSNPFNIPANSGFGTNYTGFARVPEGAVTANIEIYMYATGPGTGVISISRPSVTSANESQTLFPPYTPGPNSVPGSDPTGVNTAAGIVGQGPGATGTADQVLNDRNRLGSNQIINSDLRRQTYAHALTNSGNVESGLNGDFGAPYYGRRNTLWGRVNGNPGNNFYDLFGTKSNWNAQGFGWGNLEDTKRYGMPVKPGDRIGFRCYHGAHRCYLNFYCLVFDKDGGLVEAPYVSGTFNNSGNPGNGQGYELSGFHDVQNANAAFAILMFRAVTTDGQNDPYVFVSEEMLCKVAPGQVVMPAYMSGPSDPISDRTSDNIAGGIVGQGPGATQQFPYYAGMAAAIAAGLTAGQQFIDTTNANRLTTVVTSSTGGGGAAGYKSINAGESNQPNYSVIGQVDVSNFTANSFAEISIFPQAEGVFQNNSDSYSGAMKLTAQLVSGGSEILVMEGVASAENSGLQLPGQGFVASWSLPYGEKVINLSGAVRFRWYSRKDFGVAPGANLQMTIKLTPPA